jgi:hemerythrin-like domain-containing protein
MLIKPARRHDSLVALSREHHYGLMLCLRIHRGLPRHCDDDAWIRAQAVRAARFVATDLAAHFRAEEEALFPAMRDFADASELLVELPAQHRELERLAAQLHASDSVVLTTALGELADLLEAHIRKEERELFPLYQDQAGLELLMQVKESVEAIIGEALEPRDPELLE